jgi:hypothetical protein
MAKLNWEYGVYKAGGTALESGKEMWCISCHDAGASICNGVSAPNISGDNTSYGYYVNGHRSKLCSDCHDLTITHIDGEARTYAFNLADYAPGESGVSYAASYRLKSMGEDDPETDYDESVPLMIPTNYGTTFGYAGQDMLDNAFRLCFSCHDSTEILDDTPGDGVDTNFKSAMPIPPRDYSYSLGDSNQHILHIMQTMQSWDSDWDDATTGPGPGPGYDSLMTCSSCHNVHGAAGTEGSTNEPMIRDGSLADKTGYGFSYVIEDPVLSYPYVTSDGASLPISVGAVFRNGNALCSGNCHQPTPPGPSGSGYDASGSGSGTYLEYYRAVGTFNCSDCHAYGTNTSHPTHNDSDDSTGLKGVNLVCYDCHDDGGHVSNTVDFADAKLLSLTNACDPCHSPGGAYDGAQMAKDNWEWGVYDSQFQVLPDWQPYTEYAPGDIIVYGPNGYVCIADYPFTSTDAPNGAYWKQVSAWQPSKQYVTGDLMVYVLNVYRSRRAFTSCNPSPCPVDYNWELVKRIGAGKESLLPGNEKWCAGCHDDEPANSKKDGSGVDAPNVVGDGSTYGFYLSGHGRPVIGEMTAIEKECLDCHNSTFAHIDHEHRTYQVQESPYAVMYSYKDSYRLNNGLDVPRRTSQPSQEGEFALCEQCHTYADVFGANSNFSSVKGSVNLLHPEHMNYGYPLMYWDSDYDGSGTMGDSCITCTTCHNVHGSPMDFDTGPGVNLHPNPVMIRHGELMGSIPGLDFRWYDEAGGFQGSGVLTNVREDSRSGEMWCNPPSCTFSCHVTLPSYNREPQ